MSKPVKIRYPSDAVSPAGARHFAGAEYVVPSPEAAAEFHPDATIVAYEDGMPFVALEEAPVEEATEEEPPVRRQRKR